MRALLKLALVIGIGVAFAAAVAGLSNWRAGEREAGFRIVVDPPPTRGDIAPLRARASLYAGRPHRPTRDDVPIEDAEVDLEASQPRFELRADPGDAQRFFVYADVELSNYEVLCATMPLPPVRLVERGGEPQWVDARTRRPLGVLRLAPRTRC